MVEKNGESTPRLLDETRMERNAGHTCHMNSPRSGVASDSPPRLLSEPESSFSRQQALHGMCRSWGTTKQVGVFLAAKRASPKHTTVYIYIHMHIIYICTIHIFIHAMVQHMGSKPYGRKCKPLLTKKCAAPFVGPAVSQIVLTLCPFPSHFQLQKDGPQGTLE